MKTFRERLKDGAFGSVQIISAFVFVVIVGLITMYAVAEKKNEPFNAFVSAVGAFGQVAIAWLVYRLSNQQFAFAKEVSARQVRIETYGPRSQVLNELREWSKPAFNRPSENQVVPLRTICDSIDGLFLDVEIERLTRKLKAKHLTAVLASDKFYDNSNWSDKDYRFMIASRHDTAKAELGEAYATLLRAMYAEMRIRQPEV